ncbi:unnamed protein product [Meloidogyne enterolobii]|uniref:Uncharacterized protein n=1 Tax=Meloidogyne enterolobii TaxID=390850 RepID=A0ACB0YRA3_MELEN
MIKFFEVLILFFNLFFLIYSESGGDTKECLEKVNKGDCGAFISCCNSKCNPNQNQNHKCFAFMDEIQKDQTFCFCSTPTINNNPPPSPPSQPQQNQQSFNKLFDDSFPSKSLFSLNNEEWLKVDELKKLVVGETERTTFSPLPNCFFEIAHILVTNAYSDLENVEQLKMLVRDLQDKREAKMRTSIIKFMEQFQKEKDDIFSDKAVIHANAQLNNLSRLEICYFRAALTEPSKWLDKLFSVMQGGMKSQEIDD